MSAKSLPNGKPRRLLHAARIFLRTNSFSLCFALFAGGNAFGLVVEEGAPGESYVVVGGVAVVRVDGASFTIEPVPSDAQLLQLLATAESDPELLSKLPLGESVSKAEAIKVMDVYYRNTAFDSDSIRIRNLKELGTGYAVWCANPLLGIFQTCPRRSNKAALSGWRFDFELNGKNHSGGFTGFAPQIQFIRKLRASETTTPLLPPIAAVKLPAILRPTNRVTLGINFAPSNENIAQAFKVPSSDGVVVLEVTAGSVADRAGLRRNDILLIVGGKPLSASTAALFDALVSIEPGQEISATVWRGGSEESILFKFPAQLATQKELKLNRSKRFGLL